MLNKFTAQVEDVSFKGLAVVKRPSDQKTFFCTGAWLDEEAEFEITSEKKNYGFAKATSIITKSPFRLEDPACKLSGIESTDCSGCPWSFIDYDQQLTVKERILKSQLSRSKIKDLVTDTNFKSIIRSEKNWAYRNRAELKSDGKKVGYISSVSKKLVPITSCPVLTEDLQTKLKNITKDLPNKTWEKQSTKSTSNYTHLFINEHFDRPVVNTRTSFEQGNSGQNQELKSWLTKQIKEIDDTDLSTLELFCGSGNLTTEILKTQISDLTAIDCDKKGLKRLKNKHADEKLHTDVIDLFKPEDSFFKNRTEELLILDPPRDGFSHLGKLASNMGSLSDIIYISCNPISFIKDLESLRSEKTFTIETIQALDMFPQTPHVEVLCHIKVL